MSDTTQTDVTVATDETEPKSIWDNDLPPGDSPPLKRWPLTASIVAYSCWMVFLVAMMIVRLSAT